MAQCRSVKIDQNKISPVFRTLFMTSPLGFGLGVIFFE
nr:MAG TPA: Protein of unknown function (DUF587) [Caudoviricetes sp.]